MLELMSSVLLLHFYVKKLNYLKIEANKSIIYDMLVSRETNFILESRQQFETLVREISDQVTKGVKLEHVL